MNQVRSVTAVSASLLMLLLLPSATAYWTIAGINLGRGYDLILGNPFFLHPGLEEISEAQDPGIKESRVLAANEEKIKQEAEKQPEGLVAQCTSDSAYTLRPREFSQRMVRNMFFNNPDWHYKLKDYAISGDETDAGLFPEKALFLDEYNRCALAQVYTAEEAGMDQVTPDFTRAVCALPEQYDQDAYRHLINNYGTSVITKVKLGTLEIRRYMKTFTKMRSVRQQLGTGQPNIYRTDRPHKSSMFIKLTENMLSNLNKSEIKKEFESSLHWMVGSPIFPSAVKLGVENVDKFIDEAFWPSCEESCCGRLGTIRENVVRALNTYPHSLGTTQQQVVEPMYPVKWPRGTYSMIKSEVGEGCPGGSGASWARGRLTHTQGVGTEVQGTLAVPNIFAMAVRRREASRQDDRRKRGFGYTMGTYRRQSAVKVVQQEFCTKQQSSGDEPLWPKGSYCIYKHGDCPQGFERGWIYWDDIHVSKNEHSGTLPDGVYNSNTQIYFCCREDGSPLNEIILPVSEPFTLMRVGKRCQKVKWSRSVESSVQFDGHWTTSWFKNGYFMGGAHPDNEIKFSNNKLFYCMYRADTRNVLKHLS